MPKTLGDARPGEGGYVLQSGSSDPRIRRRLVDMGITPGTRISVRKVAPMGDPLEITLRGYELSLRRADAQHIILMDPEQEQELLEKQRAALEERKKRSSILLCGHDSVDDSAEHVRAARLTEIMMERGAAPEQADMQQPVGPVKLALVGNPNCGKTTLFNAMTGAREYVGNWPGVTVEKKEGRVRAFSDGTRKNGLETYGHEMTLVDLPGIYSLSPYSMEEVVARNFVIAEKPDAIINIVDGTNLERNLYLTVQLMELERPMIIALNMMDEVEKRGDHIDCRQLSLELGVPVVPISARTGQGVKELVQHAQALISAVHAQMHEGFHIEPDHLYDDYTHAAHHSIGKLIGDRAEQAGLPTHWAEIKLLEGDSLVRGSLALDEETEKKLDELLARYEEASPLGDHESMVADSRYRYISEVAGVCLKRKLRHGEKSLSDRIDGVLTNKYLAIPLFLVIMLAIFGLTFSTVGAWLSDLVAGLIENTVAPAVESALTAVSAADWVIRLVCDGVIAGVGGVLTFLPQIALLFFCLSLLEDSGYMARTAFIMDRAMRRFGLSGKSFIPLLMGFGCTVPATMGARTMEVEKDRRMTIMLLPFMSCSAKLPVYGLIAGAFFDRHQGLVVFGLYLLGILVGIATGLIFKKTLFKGETAPFVLELPPYRWPTLRNTFLHVWERVKHFLEKAGTLIFAMSVVLWFLQNFTIRLTMTENAAESIIGCVGGFLAPVFRPLGFGAWQAVVALISGFVAKEAVVSSLSVLYGFSATAAGSVVAGALSGTFSPLSAFSFLVFVLLYTPCMAAVATMRRELGSRKWTAGVVCYQIGVAYVTALLVYQIGTLFGL